MRDLLALSAAVLLLATACGTATDPAATDVGATPTTSASAPTTSTTTDRASTTTSPPETTTSTAAATTSVAAVPWPPARGYHEIVYDDGSDVVLLISGCSAPSCNRIRDHWLLDPATGIWTELGQLPSGLSAVGAPAAYDTESQRTVVLETAFDLDRDPVSTWVYDAAQGAWTETTPDVHPRLGVGARMVYDAESDRLVTVGGFGISDDDLVATPETWAYDTNTNTWEELTPSPSPPPINYHAMAYDSQSDRTILFGLDEIKGGATVLWSYDYNTNTWQEMPVTNGPEPASAYTRAVYDPVADRVMVFGGIRPEEKEISGGTSTVMTAHGDVWRYDYDTNTWAQAPQRDLPGPTANHGMAWVDSSAEVFVFGGGPSSDDYDWAGNHLWIYDPGDEEWTQSTPTERSAG